ncbi:MAG: thioredoxin-disulfide reductase [Rickettsiaceae bacterium]|nr:thioredoxin-disulfide reductase [Rickettsiaceae bacterium]
MKKIAKVIILGSGPAGCTAAIYAARANLSPLLIGGLQPGGQLTITTDVENFPGFADVVQGPWLMEQMMSQAKKVGTEIIEDMIEEVNLSDRPFALKGMAGTEYLADSLIIATGAQAKWLGLDSEKKYQGFGVSGCATCDGFFFKGREVVVIGGGNTAVEEALYLTNHASKVTLIHRRDTLKAEKIAQDRLFSNPKISVIWNGELQEVLGQDNPKSVTGVRIKNKINSSLSEIKCEGVFIAIGHKPNTDIFKNKLDMDEEGYITTIQGATKTSINGVFACGDVQDKIYRQAVTAAGTGCMAALDAEKYLNSH